MKLIYNYHKVTKEFTKTSIAKTSEKDGAYLIPAYATDIEPIMENGKTTKFDPQHNRWILEEMPVIQPEQVVEEGSLNEQQVTNAY